MNNMKKVLILFVMSLFFALAAGILAQSTNPWSAGANGVEKNIFLPTEAVYLSSYTVCFGQPNFNVYIINYKNYSPNCQQESEISFGKTKNKM